MLRWFCRTSRDEGSHVVEFGKKRKDLRFVVDNHKNQGLDLKALMRVFKLAAISCKKHRTKRCPGIKSVAWSLNPLPNCGSGETCNV